MSIFTRKKQITIKDFCKDFYNNQILNPKVGEIDVGKVYSEAVKKKVVEVDPSFEEVNLEKFHERLIVLRFELFALAWTHKFVSGEKVIVQSMFTKDYLMEKDRMDIWEEMGDYCKAIDGATLHWLTNLGKMNLSFNYNTREDLTSENIKDAKKLGVKDNDVIQRVNFRLWSESAWRQKFVLTAMQVVFYENLYKSTGFESNKLNDEALSIIAVVMKGFYDGAKQSIDKVKIV